MSKLSNLSAMVQDSFMKAVAFAQHSTSTGTPVWKPTQHFDWSWSSKSAWKVVSTCGSTVSFREHLRLKGSCTSPPEWNPTFKRFLWLPRG